jgi:hypothetical protein
MRQFAVQRWCLAAASALTLAVGGCEAPPPSAVAAVPEVGGPLTEHRPARPGASALQLGADCAEGGGEACLSGLCGHFSADPSAGWLCSAPCSPDKAQQCPKDWRCRQVIAARDGWMCVPTTKATQRESAAQ